MLNVRILELTSSSFCYQKPVDASSVENTIALANLIIISSRICNLNFSLVTSLFKFLGSRHVRSFHWACEQLPLNNPTWLVFSILPITFSFSILSKSSFTFFCSAKSANSSTWFYNSQCVGHQYGVDPIWNLAKTSKKHLAVLISYIFRGH